MYAKESRESDAKPSSIQEESVEKPSKPQQAYFAVRQCDSLKGPAIFFAWEDCCFYADQKENEGVVECQGFDLIIDAVEWIHERTESAAGTAAASRVSRTNPPTPNNGTTAKATSKPRDDSKNSVLPTPSSAVPSKANTSMKRQMRSPASAPPNVSTQAPTQTKTFPQVCAPFLPHLPFPMPAMMSPMMCLTMPPRIGYASPYGKPMTQMQEAYRTSLTTPMYTLTPQAKTPGDTALLKEACQELTATGLGSVQTAATQSEQTAATKTTRELQLQNQTRAAEGVGVDVPVAFDETVTPLRSEAMPLAAENAKKRKRPANDDAKWEAHFQEMARYKLKHGDCEISSKTASRCLQNWIKLNREEFAKIKEGKDTTLQAQRLSKLTKLGFNFTPKKRYPTWEERVEQCREYKTKHGKDPVKNAEGGLGTWVVLQRHRYRLFQKGEPNRLKQNQVDRLTEVGFTWDTGIKIPESTHPRRSWDESYADLIAYKVR